MMIYRDAFLTDNLPTAAALSVVLALGTVIVSAIVLRIANRRNSGGMS
jgi:multiple sugar transport system permease protein